MFGLSVRTFRQRWSLFVGAVLSVAVGVALVAAAAQISASAVAPARGGRSALEWERVRTGYEDVATVMIIAAILAAFLTVFIVATTFAFTVAQRRRDLALLRLVGLRRGQVRRLLLGEAALLGAAGAVIGVPLSRPFAAVQLRIADHAGLLPAEYTLTWRGWPSVLGAAIGLAVALLGVLAASGRAARVPPLDALRDVDTAGRAMTATRWVVGLGLLAVTAALVAVAPLAGLVAALALSLGVAVFGGIALSLLAPLLVPPSSRILGAVLGGTVVGALAAANVAHSARRSASTAAPLIVLVALVGGLAGTLDAVARAAGTELRDTVRADLAVTTTGRHVDRIAALPGVATASGEVTAPALLDLRVRNGGSTERERITSGIVAVDPAAYRRIHRVDPVAGSMDDLAGATVAVMQRTSDGDRIARGQRTVLRVGDRRVRARLVTVLPERLDTGRQVLVPRGLLPAHVLADAPAHVLVRAAPGTDPADVARTVAAQGLGTVSTLDAWVTTAVDAQQDTNDATLTVLLGLSGLYAAMAVVNAVVIAGADRRRELAVARMAGLTRRQVLVMALVESVTVTLVGLALGAVVVAAALTGIALAAARTIGTAVVAAPTALAAGGALAALVVTAATSVAVTWHATRERPVHLASARE